MGTTITPIEIIHCDFCHIPGEADKDILNRYGWYFCLRCLEEVDGPKTDPSLHREDAKTAKRST